MATNPDTAGIPTRNPSESVPAPYQRLQPGRAPNLPELKVNQTPAMFAQEAGQEIQGAGRQLTQTSEHWGEISADYVSNQFQDAANKLLHGDPNNPNPDGTPNLGYLGLKGKAALDQRADYEQRLDKLLTDARGNLWSPDSQLRFDNFSRRLRAVISSQMGTHADTQGNAFAVGTAQSEIKTNLDMLSANPNDPNIVRSTGAAIVSAHVKLAQLQGAQPGDAMYEEAKQLGLKEATKAQILSIAATDPVRAQRMIEEPKYKAQLGTDYHILADHVRTRADEKIGEDFAHGAVANAIAAPYTPLEGGQPVTKDAMSRATIGGESGGQHTNPDGTLKVSVDNAQGIGQITPGTFAQFAKPGESIVNKADNARVSRRITDYYMDKYNGDWARTAVAYFSGPGNVSPPGSPIPWVIDKEDGNHTKVSTYVADKAQRLGLIDPIKAKANAINSVESSGMTDKQKDLAERNIERRYRAAETASLADAKAKKDANDAATNEYVTQMLTAPDVSMRQKIANDPRLEGHTKLALDDALTKHLKGDVEQASQVYGDGFWEARKRILLPVGDPNRLSEPSDILAMAGPGGNLTLAGAQNLLATVKETQRSVNDHSVAQAQQSLMTYAKKRLSFQTESEIPGMPGLKDPVGERIFSGKFVPQFLSAYDAWMKGGGDPWKFLTQENVDKLVDGMRPKAQMEADKLKASGEVAVVPRAPIPPPPEGINTDTWNTLISHPPINASGQEFPIPVWTEIINRLRQNPTPQAQQYFDNHFGAGGYSAKDILDRLQRRSAESAVPGEPSGVPGMPPAGAAPAAAPPAKPTVPVNREANMYEADKVLHLTPEEKNLYQHHLGNLAQGGVKRPDGKTSSLLAATIEVDGKTYVIPTVWDNKIISPDAAAERARKEGMDKFPSYPDEATAEARYKLLHDFLEKDVPPTVH
jgi:hypothetical protein